MNYEPKSGEMLFDAIGGAIRLAFDKAVNVTLIFNDTSVTVYPSSNAFDISEKYYYKRKYEQLSSN